MRRSLFALGACALIAACTSDNNPVTAVDPAQCIKGSIAPGQTVAGRIGSTNCIRYDYAYSNDSIRYDSWTLVATKGKGYSFNLQKDTVSTNWDAMLQLYGIDPNTGAEELLAISDDEGPMNFAQLHFVAPTSGTFALRVSGYDQSDSSNYVLAARSCDPPLAPITGAVNSAQSLTVNDCVLEEPDWGNDSSYVKYYTVTIPPNATTTITVTSADFAPSLQVYGPAWGVPCYYDYQGCGGGYDEGDGTTATMTLTADGSWNGSMYTNFPGDYTLAVGTDDPFGATGAFTLNVTAPAQLSVADVSRLPKQLTFDTRLTHLTKKPRGH